ncbi:MAG: NAD(P)/FAD-dependent oxidoreductase, partial [Paracoccaceae bacterium]|nr:NAD(P)/FAD-dependent oxidoreductase [Paracoccaceae bacterium]
MTTVDLIVIGAGPAGMAAATEAAGLGLSVTVLDEQTAAGGQIYRAVTGAGAQRGAVLGQDYLDGAGLALAMQASGAQHLTGAVVWNIEADAEGITVTWSQDGHAAQLRAARLILATGALERPVPIPGWTLPGVMTAGAGQILLKASGLVAERAVLAGSGPLLYLLAAQMARAGTPPLALVETQGMRDTIRALPHL